MKLAVIGFGNRGSMYSNYFRKDERVEIVAVCDKNAVKAQVAVRDFGIKPEMSFVDEDEFFSKGKLADVLLIASQDIQHYGQAIKALNVGYDIMLEKPMAESYEKCKEIFELSKKLNRKIYVCHVLRYAPFFTYIKDALDSGEYGEVVSINLTENVVYWHQSHSYVRGNWGNTKKSTPQIIAKCCHDIDIIDWLIPGKAKSVSSFGSLSYYKSDNAPENSADYCFECPVKDSCVYDCDKIYAPRTGWLTAYANDYADTWDKDKIHAMLRDKNNPYTRCVFKCDNDAVDHQVVNILYENGATAHLTMTAFSNAGGRDIHVHCTKGDLVGSMHSNKIVATVFGQESKTIEVDKLSDGKYAHGGGDVRLVKDIIEVFTGGSAKGATSIENSLPSHAIGYAAEESRINNGKLVEIKY